MGGWTHKSVNKIKPVHKPRQQFANFCIVTFKEISKYQITEIVTSVRCNRMTAKHYPYSTIIITVFRHITLDSIGQSLLYFTSPANQFYDNEMLNVCCLVISQTWNASLFLSINRPDCSLSDTAGRKLLYSNLITWYIILFAITKAACLILILVITERLLPVVLMVRTQTEPTTASFIIYSYWVSSAQNILKLHSSQGRS